MDTEYIELLEQLIVKKETEYGNGWAKEWGAIRNQTTKLYNMVYNKRGRDYVIEKIKKYLNE
jgi:hypothetical protein